MQKMTDIVHAFSLPTTAMLAEAESFAQAMAEKLAGAETSLPMLPSYLPLPDGTEGGTFLALDFGGSNVRIAAIKVKGRKCEVLKQERRSLSSLLAGGQMDNERLFYDIASFINEFAGKTGGFLGHTFSYPVKQTGPNSAVLKRWTKELHLPEKEQLEVNGLLASKLSLLGRADIKPVVILNDTTAVLLAASYDTGAASVGSICGTGHNSCYYEPALGMVVNIESGNYRPLARNLFDEQLDGESNYPGEQWLEKMTAGNYLAKLATLAAKEAGMPDSAPATAEEMAVCLNPDEPIYPLAACILARAARLLAAEYFGINLHLARTGGKLENIAIDGSVYNKLPLFQAYLNSALAELFSPVPLVLPAHGASLCGAAVAAAIATKRCWT